MTTPNSEYVTPLPTPPLVKRDSTLAIVSLIAGIIGWTIVPFIGSIVAVITGHLAKKEIRESGGTMTGDGMALAGLILGYTLIGVVLLVIILGVVFFVALAPTTQAEMGSMHGFLPFLH